MYYSRHRGRKMHHTNAGYRGYSMSVRAVEAYEDGERPKSKWTKAAMVEAVEDALEEAGRIATVDFKKWKKCELFERLFSRTSWHHTSIYCNKTDFYAVDADKLAAISAATK